MPLVDYACSDEESESENEKEDNAISSKSVEKPKETSEIVTNAPSTSDDSDGSIFSALPKPRANLSFLSDDNKLSNLLLNKKTPLGEKYQKSERKTVKISVPSASDFNDEEDQCASKKPKLSVSNAGLFSILPPPKNSAVKDASRTFVPNSVSKNQTKKTPTDIDSKFFKKNEVYVEAETSEKDDDDDITVGGSFFGSSLTKSSKTTEPISHTTSTSGVNEESVHVQEPCEMVSFQTHDGDGIQPVEKNVDFSECNFQPGQGITNTQDNPLELDEKALHILCGGKKKRQQMPMNVIDLSGEEIMPDSKEWLLKQLTEDKKVRSHSHKKSFGPSTQERRKHQITYLAFQAKEQELELQNQWANNRMSRRQTQSKYGF